MIYFSNIDPLEFYPSDIERTHQFMFLQIFERSVESHVVVVVDGPSALLLQKTAEWLGHVLVVHISRQSLVDCKSQIYVSAFGGEEISLGKLHLLLV